jgi:hypothetical protein
MSAIPPKEIREICLEFVNALIAVLQEKLHGVYILGAAAFPDTFALGDIDFHVILKSALSNVERQGIHELHQKLKQAYPPLGGELDGYYLLLDDARKADSPISQMWSGAIDNSWALHCAHLRAGRCLTLFGEAPEKFYPLPTWEQLKVALWGEFDYIEAHRQSYPDYCILNLCRLIYSFESGEVVVSKAAAGRWACETLPEWQQIIELAARYYPGKATGRNKQRLLREVGVFFEYASQRLQKTHTRPDKK